MAPTEEHILVCDLGGTHLRAAVMTHPRGDRFEIIEQRTYDSKKVESFPLLLRDFLRKNGGRRRPAVTSVCIGFAGPVGPGRTEAFITNLGWGFEARDVAAATGIDRVILLNDFEAVGYGIETLIVNHPEAFVRLSRHGQLPRAKRKPTAVVLGAGTGLGTTILVQDPVSGKYKPVPGEGGHTDFVPVEPIEFRIAQWVREHVNISPHMPVDSEKIVSGPGLVNLYRALSEIEPQPGQEALLKSALRKEPFDRPAVIVGNADKDPLCRRALDLWIRCYARAAKNCATFPLAPGGVFLAGGIAAKILPELQSGMFMKEFRRCDVDNIRTLLARTPVYVITDPHIALYGCANVAANGLV